MNWAHVNCWFYEFFAHLLIGGYCALCYVGVIENGKGTFLTMGFIQAAQFQHCVVMQWCQHSYCSVPQGE